MQKANDFFKGMNILVTGGTGSIGRRLIDVLLTFNPKVIRVFSRDESKQYDMRQDYDNYRNIRYLIGDVRDSSRVERAMENVDIVFHLAALKHVPSCEYNPFEAVKTNAMGTQNVIQGALEANVGRVIFTSSDKSISPTNAMGATKLLAERLISAADFYKGPKKTIFTAIRFGNVLGSRGSVVPLFIRQILEKRKITLTDPKMTRFMMTLGQAVNLTLESAMKARGGEVFILKMPVMILEDLSEVIIQEVCKKNSINPKEIKIESIGLRPGEKLFEELMTIDEARHARELENMFSILPIFTNKKNTYPGSKPAKEKSYCSADEKHLTVEQIRKLLLKEKVV